LNGVTNDFDSYFKPFAECFGKSPNPPCAQAKLQRLGRVFNLCRWKSVVDRGWLGVLRLGTESVGGFEPRQPLGDRQRRSDQLRSVEHALLVSAASGHTEPWHGGRRGNRSDFDRVRHQHANLVCCSRSHRRTSIRRILRTIPVGSSCPSAYDLTSSTPSYTQVPLTGVGWPNQIAGDPTAPCGSTAPGPAHKTAYRTTTSIT